MTIMNEEQVFEKLKTIVGRQLSREPESIEKKQGFAKDLEADSLDIVELIMQFEEVFDIPIKDDVAGEMETVGDAVTFITKSIGEKAEAK